MTDYPNPTLETEIVEVNGSYTVHISADMGIGRMHIMDVGDIPTRELAEELVEYLKNDPEFMLE